MKHIEHLIEMAESECEAGHRALALSYLDQARQLTNGASELWTRMGVLYMDYCEDEAAVVCLQEALCRADPRDSTHRARLCALLGRSLSHIGKYDEAMDAYSASAELRPLASTYVLWGCAQMGNGSLVEAGQTLERALLLEPSNEEAMLNYGIVLAESRPRTAVQILLRLLEHRRDWHLANSELGYAYIWCEQLTAAEDALRQAIGLEPQWDWSYYYLYLCLSRQRRPFPEREQALQQAMNIKPSFLGDVLLGELYSEWEQDQKAEKHFRVFLREHNRQIPSQSYTRDDLRRGCVGLQDLREWRYVCRGG